MNKYKKLIERLEENRMLYKELRVQISEEFIKIRERINQFAKESYLIYGPIIEAIEEHIELYENNSSMQYIRGYRAIADELKEEIEYLEKLEDTCRQAADVNKDYGEGRAYELCNTEAEAYKKIKEHLQGMLDRGKCKQKNCKYYDELAEYAYDGCTYGCAGEDGKDKPCKGGTAE